MAECNMHDMHDKHSGIKVTPTLRVLFLFTPAVLNSTRYAVLEVTPEEQGFPAINISRASCVKSCLNPEQSNFPMKEMQESVNMDDDTEPFAIRMALLESSPSESIGEEMVTADGSRWSRFRTGIFIAAAVVILSSFIAALAVPLREAALSVEGGVELANPTWLPWRERPNDTGVPRILLWTSPVAQPGKQAYESVKVMYFTGSRPFTCTAVLNEVITCEVTMQHGRANDSDALVFYAENITASRLPQFRSAGQVWVFWATADLPSPGAQKNLSQIFGLFNWTMGRREDADVTVAYRSWGCGHSHEEDDDARENTQLVNQNHKPRKHAAWIVGECELHSLINATKEFMGNKSRGGQAEIIDVRVLPACGSKHCGSRWNCVRHIAQRYHFIIVSGMPECFQSASEIIYDAFEYDVVPVILDTEVSHDYPPKSVISFATMQNPGELATYLRILIGHPRLYRQYFAWKHQCVVEPPRVDGLCSLCGALHEKALRKSSTNSVLDWWKRPGICMRNLSSILKNSFYID